jgi:hypothetical protein
MLSRAKVVLGPLPAVSKPLITNEPAVLALIADTKPCVPAVTPEEVIDK